MKSILSALIGASLACCAIQVNAEEPTLQKVQLDIARQSLTAALNAWAEQTGFQLICLAPEVARELTAPKVKGAFTATGALEQLLAGTPLMYEFTNERTVTVRARFTPASITDKSRRAMRQGTRPRLRLAHLQDSSASSERVDSKREEGPREARDDSGRDGEDSDSIETVLVTAQKRQERLQDVPISISVLSGDDLDSSTAEGVTEALNSVPGVATTQTWQGAGTQVAMRGVTAGGPLFNGASPIGYYLDSVPFGLVKTAIAPDSSAYDLQRVEVLRGPQGTLYGASAMNGVVRVLTHDADLNDFEFKARGSFSGTQDGGDNFRGDAAVNVPLVDGRLAARAVLGYQDLSGWIDRPNESDANDAEVRNMRLKINAQPTDALSIGLTGWVSRSDYGAPSIGGEPQRNSSLIREPISTDYDVYGLNIGYEFPAISLTSMTSYVDYRNDGFLDFLGFGLPAVLFTGLDSTVFTQEINLNSNSRGPWRWSLGGIYRDGEDRLVQTLGSFFVAPTDFSDFSESTAVFGELTRLFLDGRLELTAGLRHFEDKVKGVQNVSKFPPNPPITPVRDKFEADTPRFVLSYHPGSDVTVYASYAEGFRSGFNQNPDVLTADANSPTPQFPPLKADTLKNYELGSKGSLWDGRVSIDTAVYYIDWQDVQQTVATTINGVLFFAFLNGNSASGAGFDFAASIQPAAGLQLGVNFNWNNLEWDSDVFSGGELLFGKGERLNYSPEYTIGASADYAFPLGGRGLTGRFSASANYASKQAWRTVIVGPRIDQIGDPMTVGRASFAISSPDRWTATLFADNVSNEQGTPVRAPFGIPDWSAQIRPRTLGLQLDFRF